MQFAESVGRSDHGVGIRALLAALLRDAVGAQEQPLDAGALLLGRGAGNARSDTLAHDRDVRLDLAARDLELGRALALDVARRFTAEVATLDLV